VRLRPPLIAAFVALGWAPNAAAYRPFDSTDASVAEAGKLELELGPIGYLAEGRAHFLVAPALIANLGLSRRWDSGGGDHPRGAGTALATDRMMGG